jgi:hypothetical protein
LKYFLDFALDKKENMNGKSHVFGDFILRKKFKLSPSKIPSITLWGGPAKPYNLKRRHIF